MLRPVFLGNRSYGNSFPCDTQFGNDDATGHGLIVAEIFDKVGADVNLGADPHLANVSEYDDLALHHPKRGGS